MADERAPPKKRGRPPAAPAEKGAPVLTWLPARTYDRVIHNANARGDSVSGYLRKLIILTLR
jgi:hypothetical protein